MTLRLGTFCSGIGAPEQAAIGLPIESVFSSEIEPFPCEVLKVRHPGSVNLGDMTKLHETDIPPVDLVFAGTPCQPFSVAGLRAGMADPRGNLALVFLGLVDRIRPRWMVWENVPGVLSSVSHQAPDPCPPPPPMDLECDGQEMETEDEYSAEELHALNCFVAGLDELGYGWAMGVRDAQYFGVPQRRSRVFVVAYLGDWRRAAAVLFERHSLSGNPPPSREAGQRIAASLTRGADSGGKGGYAGRRQEDDYNIVTNAVDAHMGMGGVDDNAAQANHIVGCLSNGAHNGGGSTGKTFIPDESFLPDVAWALQERDSKGVDSDTKTGHLIGGFFDSVSHSLRADGFYASEDGTGRGTPLVPFVFDERNVTSPENGAACRPGDSVPTMHKSPLSIGYTITGTNKTSRVAFETATAGCLRTKPPGSIENSSSTVVGNAMAVRRLMPTECESLQGFPRGYTDIIFRGKPAKDGPRYKALGNSMAVPVVRWILERIIEVEGVSA